MAPISFVLKILPVVAASILSSSGPSLAMAPEWKSKILELQSMERSISASMQTRDRDEMVKQSLEVIKINGWLLNYEFRNDIPACVIAVTALDKFSTLMFGEDTAQRAIEREDALSEYRDAMPACENRLGIAAARKPNLR